MRRIGLGIIGCGVISAIYLKNIRQDYHNLELVGVCDVFPGKAEQVAAEHGCLAFPSAEAMFQEPRVQLVLNLTQPSEHFAVSMSALRAGKHVYSEKPLSATLEEGAQLLAEAEARGLTLGAAPDTFLGAGIQTARKLVDSGYIGEPLNACAFFALPGHELWHPSPEFYYQPGGGPMMDMGPYYLTALINLLGPVKRVSAMGRASFGERTVRIGPKAGEAVPVNVDTHVGALLQFHSGAIANLIMSFDVQASELPRIEVFGTQGTLSVPDPNTFGGPVRLCRSGQVFEEFPLTFAHHEDSRGLGLSEMALAILEGRQPRASGALALHVLEVMCRSLESARTGERIEIRSAPPMPEAMPVDYRADPLAE